MFTLDASYYTKEFNTLGELIDDVVNSGMDPNVDILEDGNPTGECPFDLMEF